MKSQVVLDKQNQINKILKIKERKATSQKFGMVSLHYTWTELSPGINWVRKTQLSTYVRHPKSSGDLPKSSTTRSIASKFVVNFTVVSSLTLLQKSWIHFNNEVI